MPGYKDWIDAIDIKVDYFSAFMKAWIAFNAWYNFSGEVTGKTDKECIEFIGGRSNRFRSYMENLLSSETAEGEHFRTSLAALHSSLLSAAITTQEYIGVRQTVSFSEVAVKNSNARESFKFRNAKYECSRARGKITTVITEIRTGIEILRYEQDEYNVADLMQQSAFQRLSGERQRKCQDCYKTLMPYIKTSILATEDSHLAVGTYRFVNDVSKISQCIITVLYMLRCCLAHGDISPDESANAVYRYAYEILCMPLKKLK